MTTMLFLKALSDLGFIYALFSPLIAHFAIGRPVFFAAWILQALAYALSGRLKGRGAIRFLPFLLCLVPLAAGFSLTTVIFLLPGLAYCICFAVENAYGLDRDQQASIFKSFCVCCAIELPALLIFGRLAVVTDWLIPLFLMVFCVLILLLRALRHDPSVYLRVKYQLADLGVVAALAAAIAFLSSDAVRSNILAAVRFFYFSAVVPVLMLIITAIAQLIVWITAPLQRLMQKNGVEQNLDLQLEGIKDMLELGENDLNPTALEVFKYVMIAAGILLAAIILIRLFRYLSPGMRRERARQKTTIMRSFVQAGSRGAQASSSGAFSAQVRARYRSFLKLYEKKKLPRKLSSTSREIAAQAADRFDADAAERLRELYIAARYHDSATSRDAEEAKALLKTLRETSE